MSSENFGSSSELVNLAWLIVGVFISAVAANAIAPLVPVGGITKAITGMFVFVIAFLAIMAIYNIYHRSLQED